MPGGGLSDLEDIVKKWLLALLLVAGGVWLYRQPPTPEIRNLDGAGETIVCFGDSLTAGVGAGAGEDYPAQLAGLLGRPVINAGQPGDTTATALARLDAVLAVRPRIVIIILGGNDIRRGVSRQEAFANLAMIVARVQESGAMVVLGGIDIPLFSRGFGDGYRQLARESGSLLVPNVFAGIWGREGLMSDQIHPSAVGYRVMAAQIHAVLKSYLPAPAGGG